MELRLLTWNLHGVPTAPRRAPRFEAAAARVMVERPSLVLLQEVWLRSDFQRLTRRLEDGGYARALSSPAGDRPAGGLVAFLDSTSSWRIVDSRFERYRASGPLWRIWEADGLGRKGAQILGLHDRASNHGIVVINTHLQAQHGARSYSAVRLRQIQQLGRLAFAVSPDLPVVAVGDFNTRPDEAPGDGPYTALMTTWVDLTALERRAQSVTRISAREIPEWVDYVLYRRSAAWEVSSGLSVILNERPDEPYSDHHGLLASVVFKRRGPRVASGSVVGSDTMP